MNPDLNMEIGEKDGAVVIRFSKHINEVTITPEMAPQIAEKIARSGYSAKYNSVPAEDKSLMAEQIRSRMITRIAHVIRSLQEKNKTPGYIANHVVDIIMGELL